MKRLVAAGLLLCGLAGTAYAQVDRATLSGEVKDSTGAVMADSTVTATHLATNVASKARTTASGSYQILNLAPGRYLVEAEASGFQKTTQSVILETGQRARLDFALGVGGVTESVVVEEPVRLLSTDAALGAVIDQNAVSKLPLAIRNWDDLLALVPGVQGDRFTEEGIGVGRHPGNCT